MTTLQEVHSVDSIEQLVNEVEDKKLRVCEWTQSSLDSQFLVSHKYQNIV